MATITVKTSGGDYNTIQGGLDAASNGDTVTIQTGTWTENVHIDATQNGKTIVVKPETGATVLLNGGTGTGTILDAKAAWTSGTITFSAPTGTSLRFLGNVTGPTTYVITHNSAGTTHLKFTGCVIGLSTVGSLIDTLYTRTTTGVATLTTFTDCTFNWPAARQKLMFDMQHHFGTMAFVNCTINTGTYSFFRNSVTATTGSLTVTGGRINGYQEAGKHVITLTANSNLSALTIDGTVLDMDGASATSYVLDAGGSTGAFTITGCTVNDCGGLVKSELNYITANACTMTITDNTVTSYIGMIVLPEYYGSIVIDNNVLSTYTPASAAASIIVDIGTVAEVPDGKIPLCYRIRGNRITRVNGAGSVGHLGDHMVRLGSGPQGEFAYNIVADETTTPKGYGVVLKSTYTDVHHNVCVGPDPLYLVSCSNSLIEYNTAISIGGTNTHFALGLAISAGWTLKPTGNTVRGNIAVAVTGTYALSITGDGATYIYDHAEGINRFDDNVYYGGSTALACIARTAEAGTCADIAALRARWIVVETVRLNNDALSTGDVDPVVSSASGLYGKIGRGSSAAGTVSRYVTGLDSARGGYPAFNELLYYGRS